MIYRRLVRPVLFRAYGGDAERVHEQTLRLAAAFGPGRAGCGRRPARCWPGDRQPVSVAGIDFPGPVGVAAGLDKNGVAVRSWAALGFGFAELGTVTAQAQPGNDRPRLFRLPQSRAIVNRMGFNNAGAAALAQRLEAAGRAPGQRRGRDAGRHLHRQVEGHPAGRGGRGLPHLAAAAGPVRRLRRRQRVQSQHPGSAGPAGRRQPGRPAHRPDRRGDPAGGRRGARTGVRQAGPRSEPTRPWSRPSTWSSGPAPPD